MLMLCAFDGAVARAEHPAATAAGREAVQVYLDQIARRVAQQRGYEQLVAVAGVTASSKKKKKKRAEELRVLVKITVTTGGRLDYVEIERSSGDLGFDESAMELVRQAQPFGELPEALVRRGWFVFVMALPLPEVPHT
jgi:TonB family protein